MGDDPIIHQCLCNSKVILLYSSNIMSKKPSEWFKRADYDMDAAEYMFEGK